MNRIVPLAAILLQGSAQAAAPVGLLFEPNAGHLDAPEVRFVARTRQATVFFTDAETVVAMRKGAKRSSIRMSLPGSRLAQAEGERASKFTVNSFIGARRENWREGVKTYERIVRRSVYPGIDIAYYGTDLKQLEYDFIVHPGADPSKIRMRFSASGTVRINERGELEIRTPAGTLRNHRPKVYEAESGKTIEGQYKMLDRETAGLLLAAYDRKNKLIVDPVISFSELYDGEGDDVITCVSRGAYAGYTNSVSFPRTRMAHAGGYDAFFVSMASSQISYIGGSGDDRALALDSTRSKYTFGGETNSPDFPQTGTASAAGGGFDAFVAGAQGISDPRFGGSSSFFSTRFGGSGNDRVLGIADDTYVGETESPDFAVTPNAIQKRHGGGLDGFVRTRSMTTYWGGSGNDSLRAVTIFGDAYDYDRRLNIIGGNTDSGDIPLVNPAQAKRAGGRDGYVAAFVPATGEVSFASYLGGSGDERIVGIGALGRSIWVGGTTLSHDFPDASPLGGDSDGFLVRLDNGVISKSRRIGGSGDDTLQSMTRLDSGDLLFAGSTDSQDLRTRDALWPTYLFMQRPLTEGGDSNGFFGAATPDLEDLPFLSYYEDRLAGTGYDSDRGVIFIAGTRDNSPSDAFAATLSYQLLHAAIPPVAPKLGTVYATVSPTTLADTPTRLRISAAEPGVLAFSLPGTLPPSTNIDAPWRGGEFRFGVHGLTASGSTEVILEADGFQARRFRVTAAPIEASIQISSVLLIGVPYSSIYLTWQVRDPVSGALWPADYWDPSPKVEFESSAPDVLSNTLLPLKSGTAMIVAKIAKDGVRSLPTTIEVREPPKASPESLLVCSGIQGLITRCSVNRANGVKVTSVDPKAGLVGLWAGSNTLPKLQADVAFPSGEFLLFTERSAASVQLRVEIAGVEPFVAVVPVGAAKVFSGVTAKGILPRDSTAAFSVSMPGASLVPLEFKLTSSDSSILSTAAATLVVPALTSYASVGLQSHGVDGSAELRVEPPAGLTMEPASTFAIQVSGLRPFGSGYTVGKDLQIAVPVQAGAKVTSRNPAKLLISSAANLPGSAKVIAGAAGIFLQALTDSGTAEFEVETAASGVSLGRVQFVPSSVSWGSPHAIQLATGQSGQFSVSYGMQPSPASPWLCRQQFRASAKPDVCRLSRMDSATLRIAPRCSHEWGSPTN